MLRVRFGWVVLTLLPLGGCASVPLARVSGPRVLAVSVIDRGWHTELGLSVHDLPPPLSRIAARFPGARVLTFGFGDRAFVLNRTGRLTDALGALFPSPGLILVTALNTSADDAFGAKRVVRIPISRQAFDHIARFVWQSIAIERGQKAEGPKPYGPGPYPGTLYYAASVTYDAFNTCNTWVASALRAGGVPVRASGVLFASQIMSEVRRIAPQQGGAEPLGQAAGAAGAGTTTVVPARGGGGLLLLNEMQPPSKSGARRAKRDQRNRRIAFLLEGR